MTSMMAPRAPPMKLGIRSPISICRLTSVSLRYPIALLNDPGQRAAVFVALATISSSPRPTRAGKEMRVPPPATALIDPAIIPAIKSPIKPSR